MSENNLYEASRQWASRPEDQRFLTLEDLKASVLKRRQESWTVTPAIEEIKARAVDGGIGIEVYDPTKGEDRILFPTNFAFNH
jgi:hypothetical protein